MRSSVISILFCLIMFSGALFAFDYQDDVLIFSNYPESIKQSGVVYDGELDHPRTRFSYYHMNDTTRSLYFSVQIHNLESKVVTLNLIKAVPTPLIEGLAVGHHATYQYLSNLLNNGYETITLQPNERRSLLMQHFYPRFVVGGFFKIVKSDSVRIKLNVAVLNNQTDTLSRVASTPSYFTCGVYDTPHFLIEADFDFKLPIQDLQFGAIPFLLDRGTGTGLKGNYAAFYKYDLSLINRNSYPIFVDFMFSPISGAARGSFVIDGQLYQNPREKNYVNIRPEVIQSFEVSPQSKRNVIIYSIPESGSFYPLNFVFKRRLSLIQYDHLGGMV